MKNLFYLALCTVLLTSCDPELTYVYSIQNEGLDTIFADVKTEDVNLEFMNTGIAPGETREIMTYVGVGTTEGIETTSIFIQELEIENASGDPYNKDPLDNTLWETTVESDNAGLFLLRVGDEDF